MTGQTISHYRIAEKLGEGGMGVVYKAEDTQLRRTVALKFLTPQSLNESETKARLIREAQAAASLDHPNICSVHGIHEEGGHTFIAMAYVDGMSLADKIKQRPLAFEEALNIALQMGEGLQEAHERGVVHRDIKLANIMLTRKERVKIMDFGLAYLAGRSKLTKSGMTLGTPVYMSPEQALGQPADRRSDIWSLGVVLYEMIAGQPPFNDEHQQAIIYSITNEAPEPLTARAPVCRSRSTA
jgi:serine/threonine protein kinase